MIKALATILAITWLSVPEAVDHWLQPEKFIYNRTETINLRFYSGKNFYGKPWNGNRDRVEKLSFYYSTVSDHELGAILSANPGDSLQIAMIDEGTAVITLETVDTLSTLTTPTMNTMLEQMNNDFDYRHRYDHGSSGEIPEVLCLKTILQVGKRTDNTCHKTTRLPLDIVPVNHPYNFGHDGNFRVAAYFRGEPLKLHDITVWHAYQGKVTAHELQTDEDGECKFFFHPAGRWMISVDHLAFAPEEADSVLTNFRGSLTFGFF